MCLGHVARIHGHLDLDRCLPAIRGLLADEATRGKAEDALADIRAFVRPTETASNGEKGQR